MTFSRTEIVPMPIDVVDLSLGGYQRGWQWGVQRRTQIQHWIQAWRGSLKTGCTVDPEHHIDRMLKDTDFLPAIDRNTPELLEEVRGIADGADLPFDIIFAGQLMDEEWAYRRASLRSTEAVQKCSSAAVSNGGGVAWVGQNMDLGGYTDGHQRILRMSGKDEQDASLIFTIGGMIALMGVNARGLAVCVNALPQLPCASEGVPVAFIIRKLLAADGLAEASRLVQSLPHATGQHYLLADAYAIRSFEASPDGVFEYHAPDRNRVLHTNHPLVERLTAATLDNTNSIVRLRSLTQRLMTNSVSTESLKDALSSSDDPNHPICRITKPGATANPVTGMVSFTTGSIVSELRSSEPPVCWVSSGPPALRGYNHVRWANDSD